MYIPNHMGGSDSNAPTNAWKKSVASNITGIETKDELQLVHIPPVSLPQIHGR